MTEEGTKLFTATEPAENVDLNANEEDLDAFLKTILTPTNSNTTPQTHENNVISKGVQDVAMELVASTAQDYQPASFDSGWEQVVPEDIKPPAIQPFVQPIPKVVQWSTALNNYHVKSGGKFTISLQASSKYLKRLFHQI